MFKFQVSILMCLLFIYVMLCHGLDSMSNDDYVTVMPLSLRVESVGLSAYISSGSAPEDSSNWRNGNKYYIHSRQHSVEKLTRDTSLPETRREMK
jgi:hypothetical protein